MLTQKDSIDLTNQKFGKLLVIKKSGKRNGSWLCLCECGKESIVNNCSLQWKRSCGKNCKSQKTIIGEKHNFLTAESFYGSSPNGKLYVFRCECGNTITRKIGPVRCGNTKSCGCLKLKRTSEIFLKNITGQRFNRLVVIKISHRTSSQKVMWECICDCGNTTYANGSSLKRNLIKSCGCLHKEVARARFFKDITGKIYGRLTVIKEVREKKYVGTDAFWECKCDCGVTGIWSTHNLNSGNTTSCGCYTRDMSRMMFQNSDFQSYCQMKNQIRGMVKRKEITEI
jgi:hypothetical protein